MREKQSINSFCWSINCTKTYRTYLQPAYIRTYENTKSTRFKYEIESTTRLKLIHRTKRQELVTFVLGVQHVQFRWTCPRIMYNGQHLYVILRCRTMSRAGIKLYSPFSTLRTDSMLRDSKGCADILCNFSHVEDSL